MFCMGNPKKTMPDEIFHLYTDDLDEYNQPAPIQLTQEEEEEMQAEMDAENERLAAEREKQKKSD